MSMPIQKPGRSKQDYQTPDKLIRAVEDRFGDLLWDLAATKENTKCPYFITPEMDSFKQPWHELAGNLFLNPPFEKIGPWAEKCRDESRLGASIFMLVPASVGSNWFRDYVHGWAYVLALNPRVTFVGCTTCYPKDLVICVYSNGLTGFDVWRWK